MFCSKCKIFSFHLPNYDSYICENGHVLCRTCNDDMNQDCAVCGCSIVRQAEFRLEGIPTAIFKDRKKPGTDQGSNPSDSCTDDWFYQRPREFGSDAEWQSKPSECEDLNWNLNSSKVPIGDHAFIDFSKGGVHTVDDRNVEHKNFHIEKCKNFINIAKPSKSACKFKKPDSTECDFAFTNSPQYDPKDLYEKTLKGEVDFDPKEDYYQRAAQIKEIEEYFKRPNLEIARKSSSKLLFHKEAASQSEPAILKENFKDPTSYLHSADIENQMNFDKKEFEIELGKNQLLDEHHRGVNVDTMMDLCIEPCLNFINFNWKHEKEFMPENKPTENIKNLLDIKTKISDKQRESPHHILNEQRQSELCSPFDKDKLQQTDNFTDFHPDQLQEMNCCTLLQYINREIEKALSKLPVPVEVPVRNNREELIRESKSRIRKNLLQEVYSNFDTEPTNFVLEPFKSNLNVVEPTYKNSCQMAGNRTIGISTESNPKLNYDYILLRSPIEAVKSSFQGKLLEEISERCLHNNPKKKITTQNHNSFSEFSKFSEGPFIQSTEENEFEKSSTNVKRLSIIQQENAINELASESENIVQYLKYPDDTFKPEPNLEMHAIEQVLESPPEGKQYELKKKNSDTLTLRDLKEKFPNISVKQIKDIILNLPCDSDELNADDYDVDYSKTNFLNKTSEQKLSETLENISTTTSVNAVAWRAFYSPISNECLYSEPAPQYKPISFDIIEDLSTAGNTTTTEIRPASDLNIPRNPVICPLTACKKLIFVSEFSKHIKVDHAKIPVECVSPGKCKNLFLDPKVDHHGINKCHCLYLITDKIRDLGSREYKNFLPVLVMSTKVNLIELIYPDYRGNRGHQPYLMIWLTGLNPTNMPIYFSLTAWSRSGPIPKCHIVHSGELYSIRNEQDAKTLFRAGQVLLLSQEQCYVLTNNGRNMLELQVVVH